MAGTVPLGMTNSLLKQDALVAAGDHDLTFVELGDVGIASLRYLIALRALIWSRR